MDSNQRNKIVKFKKLQKEIEKNAKFEYHLPTLNHKDIQVDFERELIDDIIQKYKKYKECISKLEK